jgi:peptidoglycan/LPS O-acetylase OafA/YrhL
MSFISPLPVLVLFPLVALACWLLARRMSILEETAGAHAHTLALDGLRGILATSVFFHHAAVTRVYLHTGVWQFTPSNFYDQLGPAPVTMFFFISGFLFWRKMLRNPASVRYRVLLPNRIRRIVPAYAAVMLLLLLIGTLAAIPNFRVLEATGKEWLFYALTFGFLNTTVFDADVITAGVFWTLQVEWLFYLTLPLLRPFRAPWKFLALMACLFTFSSVALARMAPAATPQAMTLQLAVFFCFALSSSFSVGMLAAWLFGNARFERIFGSRWMPPVALFLVGLELFRVRPEYTWREPLLLAPAFLMVVAGNSIYGLLTSPPARALGLVSYSFYILHGTVLYLCIRAAGRILPVTQLSAPAYWLLIGAIGILVALLSTLSYRFIERPFLRSRSRRPEPLPQMAL